MRNCDPIAYTYEADVHCPKCAEARFGICDDHGQIACCVEDREGNRPGVIAPWDEWVHDLSQPDILMCGTCGEVIETYDPKEYEGEKECDCEAEENEDDPTD